MHRLLALMACMALSSCSTPAPIDVTVACPPLRAWSPAEQAALALNLAKVSRDSEIWVMSEDWISLRDAVRACNNSPKH